MRVCLPKPRLASPAAAAKDLPSDPMQTVHPVRTHLCRIWTPSPITRLLSYRWCQGLPLRHNVQRRSLKIKLLAQPWQTPSIIQQPPRADAQQSICSPFLPLSVLGLAPAQHWFCAGAIET